MVITDSCATLDRDRIRITIEPVGEIDAGSVGDFEDQLHSALCRRPHEIDVDLRGVSFLDTAALRSLEMARESLATTGGHLCLRNPVPQVQRLLSLTAFVPGAV